MAQPYQNFRPPFRTGPMYGNYGSPPNQHQKPYNGNTKRMLMRELVTSKVSDTQMVGYYISVVQSPLRRGPANNAKRNIRYDGLEQGDPDLAPWVLLRSRYTPGEEVTFPISMCAQFHKHLLSCADAQLSDNSFDSSGEADKSDQSNQEHSAFNLWKLAEIDFQDQAVSCSLKVVKSQPVVAKGEASEETSSECARRWLTSGPIPQPGNVSSNGDNDSRPMPLHLRTVHLELYESLLPNLVNFLSKCYIQLFIKFILHRFAKFQFLAQTCSKPPNIEI